MIEICYSNLAFAGNKGQKRPIFGFKPLKRVEGLEIQLKQTYKKFLIKNLLAFTADERHKGQKFSFGYINALQSQN